MAGKRPQQGIVLPSPLMLLSVAAVLVAAVVFLATRGGGSPEPEAATPAGSTASATADPSPTAQPSETSEPTAQPTVKPRAKPDPVDRGSVYVEVYNNAGITGLADRVGSEASGSGWNVVGTDNWYGTVPSSTVYYPGRLERQADQLAQDLGIDRVMPAVGAMKGDRLTVILTGEL